MQDPAIGRLQDWLRHAGLLVLCLAGQHRL